MSTLAHRLRLALERRPALSQAGLARACGVSTATVSNWVNGNIKTLRSPNLRKAAEFLRCSRDWLESGAGSPGWMDDQHPIQVRESPVAQYVSQPNGHTMATPAQQVPVIGTLGLGAQDMYVLDSPDGQPIGTVLAYAPGPHAYAVRIFGDALYPAVRHGACLTADPDAPCVEGELVLLETHDGNYLVCELVAMRDDAVTVSAATGGQRRTLRRRDLAAVHAITDVVSSSRFTPSIDR